MYSVVLPIFNEETCLSEVLSRLMKSLESLGREFEIICVNDSSTDQTWSIVTEFHVREPRVKGLRFSRNFGHQAAVYAGIKHARGEFIAVLDADGQDPPELLPEMFARCLQGFDVVYGVRKKRKESLLKRVSYRLFYRLYKVVVPFDVPLDAGDFSVFNRNVALFIQSLEEKRPFIRGLRSWRGGRQCGFEYERSSRISGKPKYGFYNLLLLAINGALSFSKFPLRCISLFGIATALLGFGGGLYFILLKLTVGIDLPGWTSIAVLVIFFGGINLFVLGMIGEYIGDIFDEVKDRPAFIIDETLGFDRINEPTRSKG